MSRGVFNFNNTPESVSFWTTSSSATTFDPIITASPGRVHMNMGDGTVLVGSNFSHTYSDNGDVKKVTVYSNDLSKVYQINANSDNWYGHMDFTKFDFNSTGSNLSLPSNPQLTGITFSNHPQKAQNITLNNCDLTGHLDISMFDEFSVFNGKILIYSNSNLTGITVGNISQDCDFEAYGCNLTGTLDVRSLTSIDGSFRVDSNSNLTKILHYSANTGDITSYRANNCDLTGHHNMSGLGEISSFINMGNNPNLTGVTLPYSNNTIGWFQMDNCALVSLDLTSLQKLSGLLLLNNNNLTNVLLTASTNSVTYISLSNNNLLELDLTPFSNISGGLLLSNNPLTGGVTFQPSTGKTWSTFQINNTSLPHLDLSPFYDHSWNRGLNYDYAMELENNAALTGITFPYTTNNVFGFDLRGATSLTSLDLSNLVGLSRGFSVYQCSSLTGITFPYSTKSFHTLKNTNPAAPAFYLAECNLGYIDFKPLSGATLLDNYNFAGGTGVKFDLINNNMSAADVNHILEDFDLMCNTLNPNGWSGGTLDISGTNSAPDGSSGGFDGLTAINNLTGGTNNWTIITS